MGRRRKQRAGTQPDWVNAYIATTYGEDSVTHECLQGYDSRDGSRDQYIFREDGRYGSFPVHDDYGDESFPD